MSFPQQLIDGYRAFLVSRLRHEQDRYRALSESGQSPQIMVIGCCDLRVSPEVIFDARPGELFVVRNIGGLVPPYTPDGAQRAVSAALEFAVQALKVKHIVVLGHAQCGGIRAFRGRRRAAIAGRFHRALDGADRAGGEGGRAARRSPARGISDAARAGLGGQDARQPDDVSLRADSGRARQARVARRLFRRRDRPAFGMGQNDRQFAPVAGDEHARLFASPRF